MNAHGMAFGAERPVCPNNGWKLNSPFLLKSHCRCGVARTRRCAFSACVARKARLSKRVPKAARMTDALRHQRSSARLTRRWTAVLPSRKCPPRNAAFSFLKMFWQDVHILFRLTLTFFFHRNSLPLLFTLLTEYRLFCCGNCSRVNKLSTIQKNIAAAH